jgi:hypothetical protein
MKKIIFLLSFTFLILQSCSSGDSNSSNNPLLSGKLKRIHLILSNGTNTYSNYFYDNNGSLVKITETNESGSITAQSITLVRNNNGKIINQLFVDYAGGVQINTDYVLDSNGFYLSSNKTYTGASNSPISATYFYSNNKISQINFSDGNKEKYTYDTNGNLLKTEKASVNSSWLTDGNYTYDNKENPLQYDNVLLSEFGSGSLGNNNATSLNTVNRPENFATIIQYNYNADNKPLSASYTRSNSQSTQIISGTHEYFYY